MTHIPDAIIDPPAEQDAADIVPSNDHPARLRVDYRDTPAHVRDAEQDAICHELNRLQRLPDDMLTAMLVGCAEELHKRKVDFRGPSKRTVRIELAVEHLIEAQRY